MATVTCVRCGQTREGMAFQPFQNDLGRRAFEQICGVCWGEWTKFQQQLINHYGLNLREREAKEFLYRNMEKFLFGEPAGQTGEQQGSGADGQGGSAADGQRGSGAGAA